MLWADDRLTMPTPFELTSDLYVSSPSTRPPLRIGVLMDSPHLSQASASVLRDIRRSDFAQLELIVYSTIAPRVEASCTRAFTRVGDTIQNVRRDSQLLWALYSAFDQRFRSTEPDPLATSSCESPLKGIDSVTVAPVRTATGESFTQEAVASIRAKDLDVLLRFGFTTNEGEILETARFGIWSLHYGDYDYYRGGPSYFWELYEGNLLSGATLIVSDRLEACRVLAKALFPTQLGISVWRNSVQPYWCSSQLIMQKLWELHAFGWAFAASRIIPSTPYRGKKQNYRTPTNSELLRWFAPQATAKLYGRVRRGLTKSETVLHWQMAIRLGGRYIVGPDGKAEIDGFQWIKSPKGHFYADPFVLERDGQQWVFFEDYDYQRKRGSIACAAVSASGDIGDVQVVVEADSHLSYPHIFADGDSLYMIPENGSARVVRLYRCVKFPQQWSPVADLFRGPAFDTSVWKQDGLWWFFTTLQDPRGSGVALYLFFSECLTGEWQYHPANPISFDVRNARSAGRLFENGGKLIRPSQNGTIRYGHSFALNEVVALTRSTYEERTIFTVEPNWFTTLMSTHTYNRDGSIEAIDGQRLTHVSRL